MKNSTTSTGTKPALWKWLCIPILLYVFVAGWFVPLNPGIIEVKPDRIAAGQSIEIQVTGYNSHFTQHPDKIRAWLRLQGDTVLAASFIKVKSDRQLLAGFSFPSVFPNESEAHPMTLVLDNPVDGISILPNALFLTPASTADSADMAVWFVEKIEDVHVKKGIQFPFRNILAETIRNTYFHVPMWFGMIILFAISAWHSLKYYRKGAMIDDVKSIAYIRVGLVFGMLGIVTGMLWAKYTWNAYWSWDVKQNMSAIALLIYAALVVMRSSLEDHLQRARLTAGYNLFAFALLIPLLFIIPRMADSLHPGNGGNPAFGGEDLDNTMRMVFYPAVIGFTMLGIWISQLVYRIENLKRKS